MHGGHSDLFRLMCNSPLRFRSLCGGVLSIGESRLRSIFHLGSANKFVYVLVLFRREYVRGDNFAIYSADNFAVIL